MAPRTDLDVCNSAIARMGGETIAAIDDTTPAGAYCLVEYPLCRDWLLSKYRWAFARGLASLALIDPTPDDCPSPYAFSLPADLVGAIYGYSPASCAPEYVNGYIAASASTLKAEYTRRVAEAAWPMWFFELVRVTFAAGLASSVGQNQGLAQSLQQIAFGDPRENGEGGLYAQARNEDSRMAPRRVAFSPWDDGPLVGARYGWGWPGGGPYGFPFVALPSGPPQFIDFSGPFILDESLLDGASTL